jgi:transmembrane sensor
MDDRTPQIARSEVDPPWDELRERRVLDAVLRANRQQRDVRTSITFGRVFAVACSLLIVGVAARYTGILGSGARGVDTRPPAIQDPVETHALLDGSLMHYAANADVQVIEQHESSVAISQTKGRVRYEVRHNPDRRFTVRAGAVEVLVVGTVFVVDARGNRVTVHVEHGRVQVHDERREVDLTDDEEVQMNASTPVDVVAPEPATAPSESAEPTSAGEGPANNPATVPRLLAQADRARAAGNLNAAITALSAVVNKHPHDPRAVSAWFILGRVEGQQGRHADAARAFSNCRARAPSGPLAEDALAEEAAAWQKAGQADRAQAAARRYLDLYPAGTHVPLMRPFLE